MHKSIPFRLSKGGAHGFLSNLKVIKSLTLLNLILLESNLKSPFQVHVFAWKDKLNSMDAVAVGVVLAKCEDVSDSDAGGVTAV